MAEAGRFDTFLFADYSGARGEAAQRRAIRLFRLERGGRPKRVRGSFTREALRERLLDLLAEATRASRRVLFGIDHQWSWPRDLWRAAGLDDLSWREALACLVAGSPERSGRPPLGPPDAFPTAFNAWAGAAVFHSRVGRLARRYGLPIASHWPGDPVRLTERLLPAAKPATRLGGVGAVAGQTLHGLRELHALLVAARARGIPVLVWPLDALRDDGKSHLGVEVYPSLYRPARVSKSDDADARWSCLFAARADLARELDLSRAPAPVREAARIEGWILGAPYQECKVPSRRRATGR
jgi:hypothetical protein